MIHFRLLWLRAGVDECGVRIDDCVRCQLHGQACALPYTEDTSEREVILRVFLHWLRSSRGVVLSWPGIRLRHATRAVAGRFAAR